MYDMKSSPTINQYKKEMKECLRLYTELDESLIDSALDYSIDKRYNKVLCTVDNSYTHSKNNLSLLALADYIMSKEPIVTAHGTMFRKHADCPNPMGMVIQQFLDQRGIDKKKMFQFPKGSEEYEKYNLMQQLDKIDANGIYGVLGMYTSLLFNINVSSSITAQGRALISSASMMFESFLANNVKFGSLDEVLIFINNVKKEKRNYLDEEYIDKPVDVVDCFAKIIDSCGYLWAPDEDEMDIIWKVLINLGQRDINRVYYKNNLYEFCSNSRIKRLIVDTVKRLRTPFFNPLDVPAEIKDNLVELESILSEFVFYDKMIIDRIDRCDNMMKSVIMISDTDSCIVSLDAWYRFVLDLVKDEDLYIMKYDPISIFDFIEKDEFGDIIDRKKLEPFEFKEDERYDFETDEIRYQKHMIDPFEIRPSDYIRWSIVNILAFVIDKFINKYMLQFTKNNHSWAPEKPCKIIMKNEFSFNRLLLTQVKKSYATVMKVQEGNLIPEDNQLDVKGIAAIAKSSMSDKTRKEFRKILLEDILTAPTIDQFKIVEKLCIMEKKIINSLQDGERDYYKPVKIKSINSYENPMRIQGIKASYVWNYLNFDHNLPSINLEERNAVDIVNVELNLKNVDTIKDKYPELYEKTVELLNTHKEFGGSIDTIAVPKDMKVPEWIRDIIDYKTIVNNNMKGFVYDSIGLTRVNNDMIYSNILQI